MHGKFGSTLGVVGLVLTACSSGISGQPSRLPYVRIDAATVVAQPISAGLTDRVLSLSPDGKTVIVESEQYGVCAVPVNAGVVKESDNCAGLGEDAPIAITSIDFNVSGRKALLHQDFLRSAMGGAWIFDVASGGVMPIELTDGPIDEGEGFIGMQWNLQQNEIVGITYQLADGIPVQRVVRVAPDTGRSEMMGEPLGEDEEASGPLVTAGDRLVYTSYTPATAVQGLVSVDLSSGSRQPIAPLGGEAGPLTYVLDISPDGNTALLQQVDRQYLGAEGLVLLDLTSEEWLPWAGSTGQFVTSAAYAPDGGQVLLLDRKQGENEEYRLKLYSASGEELKDLIAVPDAVGPQSQLSWGEQDLITVQLSSAVGAADPIGWQLVG